MVLSKHLLRLIHLLAALGSGTALLGIVLLGLGALSAIADITDTDPQFQAITVTATLPISDTAPDSGIARTIYFNNDKASGVLTLAFNISGTPTLTLTCGPGFDQTTERVYTSSDSPWSPVITYSVASEHGDQDLAFTATNTNSVTATLVLTFTQDITAPEIFITDTFFAVLSTTDLPTYTISGQVTDTQAGVQAIHVLTGTGGAWHVASLSGNDWLWEWTLPEEDWAPYTLTIRATDHVSNMNTVTGTTYVDTVPPVNPDTLTSTVPTNTWGIWMSLPMTWTAGYDGSNVISYAYALTTTWPYSVGMSDPVTTVRAITLPLDSDGVYTFSLRTLDLAGNLATDTIYSGPFLRDATSPTVHVTVTQKSVNRLLVDWSDSTDPIPGSGIAAYEVYTSSDNGPWTSWLPSTPVTQSVFVVPRLGVTYTFSVTASDRADNREQNSVQFFCPLCRLYLPVVMKKYKLCLPDPYEPNDAWTTAWGPLQKGIPYTATICPETDSSDWYTFTINTLNPIAIDLIDLDPGTDFNLYVYLEDPPGTLVPKWSSVNSNNADEHVQAMPTQTGTYYVRVYRNPDPTYSPNVGLYTLEANFD